MLIKDQYIEINSRRHDVVDYYKSKGYNAELNKPFLVKAEDLTPGSGKIVKVICDYCGKEYEMQYKVYYKNVIHCDIQKCACTKCGSKKYEEIHMLKYGVHNPMQRNEIREKAKNTCIKKYGVDNPMKLDSCRDKRNNTSMDRYGYVSPFQIESVQKKIIDTRLKKYGVKYIFQSKELRDKATETFNCKYNGNTPLISDQIKNKVMQTCKEKYGTEYALSSDEILSKVSESRYNNGTCKSSKEQRRIAGLFNGKLNYPIGRYNVDVLLDDNIALEYDGGAHDLDVKFGRMTQDEFDEREMHRVEYIISKGFTVIKFINIHDCIIDDCEYINALEMCKNYIGKNKFIKYNLENKEIELL